MIWQITHEEDKCGKIASPSNPFTDYETPQFHKYSCKLTNDIIIQFVGTDSDCLEIASLPLWHMLHVAYHPISRHCGSTLSLPPSPLVCFLFLLIHIRMSAPFPLPILARTEEQEDGQIASRSESPLVQRDHDIFSLPHFNFPLFLSSLFFTPSNPPSFLCPLDSSIWSSSTVVAGNHNRTCLSHVKWNRPYKSAWFIQLIILTDY